MTSQLQRAPIVIVVEDDPVLSVVLQRALQPFSPAYKVMHVSDGFAALEQFDRAEVALLITDYMLRSNLDGLKLIRQVRERSPETRLVLISAYATPELEEAAAQHGVDFYLPKPFLLQDLEHIVKTELEIWQSPD